MRRAVALPASGDARIGLFGGSFNPPHAGHVEASLHALRRCGLDRVWWLVTPGNPLKAPGSLAAMDARLAAIAQLTADPRLLALDVERRLGTRYTDDLVEVLLTARPETRFVLVIGADNWAGFHRWRRWQDIAARLPIAVVDRPGATWRALTGQAATRLARARVPERDAARLADLPAPAWCFLSGLRNPLSSTALRAAA